MAYPPPPGHSSLPPRPPPSTASSNSTFKPSNNATAKSAFTAFAPRAVTSNANAYRTNSPAQYSALPVSNYSAAPSYSAAPQTSYQAQSQYDTPYQGTESGPQIRNPFVPTSNTSTSNNPYGSYDPEYEAQIQQWQSAYMSKDDKTGPTISKPNTSTNTSKTDNSIAGSSNAAQVTVQRSGGGATWQDQTLLEWDPAHFRIFVGNLAGEVTDDSLLKAFSQFPSVQKARVIRDKRTTKSKGYGFVSFSDGDEYFQAAKEMQGKYIGSHPVLIKRAMTEVRPTNVQNNKGKKNKGRDFKNGGHDKVDHGGIQKKVPKTKGGLRVLG